MARQRPRWRHTSTLRRTLCARRFAPRREQIDLVVAFCRKFPIHGEDISGDVIWGLYEKRAFQWPDDEIIAYAQACLRNARIKRSLAAKDRINLIEGGGEGLVEAAAFYHLSPRVRLTDPETFTEASMAREIIRLLPDRQRQAIEILADGGTPLDIAREMSVEPQEALQLIGEARDFVSRV